MIKKNYNNSNFSRERNKKFILVSNTSRYLFHYRSLLLDELKNNFKYLYVIAPEDEYTKFLIDIVNL